MRNASDSLAPPEGLPNDPGPASLAGVAKLRKNAPHKHARRKGQRTSHQSAPKLVARMTMMNTNFISGLPGVMVTDRNNWREKHVVACRHTLQAIVRFFVHMVKSGFKARQLDISGSPQNRSRIGKRTRELLLSELALRKSLWILIGSLRKMQHRESRTLLKERNKSRNAVRLLRIAIVVESEYQISPRFTHHAIARSHGTDARLVYKQPRLGELRFHRFHDIRCTAV